MNLHKEVKMGYYINVSSSKEAFLSENASKVQSKDIALALCEDDPESIPIVLIDNKLFTAAGIAYCREELEAFTEGCDPRPKEFFVIKTAKLEEAGITFPKEEMDFFK